MSSYEKLVESIRHVMAYNELEKVNQTQKMVTMSPENEIGLAYHLVTPDNTEELISKNLRIGNLSPTEHMKVMAGVLFLSWLVDKINSGKLTKAGGELLRKEVFTDMSGVALTSASKGGALMEEILSPKRRFQMLEPRENKKLAETRESMK